MLPIIRPNQKKRLSYCPLSLHSISLVLYLANSAKPQSDAVLLRCKYRCVRRAFTGSLERRKMKRSFVQSMVMIGAIVLLISAGAFGILWSHKLLITLCRLLVNSSSYRSGAA